MDPITTVMVLAATSGAAAGLTDVSKGMITDAYNAVKTTLQDLCGSDSKVVQAAATLEEEPDFEPHQTALAARLKQADLLDNSTLLAATQTLADVLQENAPAVAAATGVSLEDITGVGLRISRITATGSGVVVKGAKMKGDIEITDVQAGDSSPKANPPA